MHWAYCEFLMVSGLPVPNMSDIGEKKINITIVNFLFYLVLDNASRSIFF